jgi:hypothetical protein
LKNKKNAPIKKKRKKTADNILILVFLSSSIFSYCPEKKRGDTCESQISPIVALSQ